VSDITTRILYVDDDEGLARLAGKALSRIGIEVLHAPDHESGLTRLAEGGIGVIILDHYLRGTTGLTFLQALRERGIEIPVIYVTGSSEATVAVEALKAGAEDYVIKTVGEDFWALLRSAVQQALENAELRAAKQKADREIVAAKERAEILLAEVNHRVANSLALVAALIRMQASSSSEPAVKVALSETQARISAIAGMHRSLYTSDDVRIVEMSRYLSTLVSELRGTLEKTGRKTSIETRFDNIDLASDRAVSVGMIVTELLTNAIKYAYPAGEDGAIRVVLERTNEGEALLVVEDDGVGYDIAAAPNGTGLGSRIVASMAKTIGEGIRYVVRSRGTRAEVPIALT
jgi:two-component sensor histidine kinase/CheY-like chemotaxis protein